MDQQRITIKIKTKTKMNQSDGVLNIFNPIRRAMTNESTVGPMFFVTSIRNLRLYCGPADYFEQPRVNSHSHEIET